jgi:hypothetical protein
MYKVKNSPMNKFDRAEYRGLEISRPKKYIILTASIFINFAFAEMN